MIRATVKPDRVAQLVAAAEKTFAAIAEVGPIGVHYASTKLADDVTFVVLLALEKDTDNPLATIPEFVEFQQSFWQWIDGPPAVEEITVVGSYGLF
jgi:hypothetical protein